MPEIGARERVTTWKILIIKKESGILRVVIADPLISANKHVRARTHTYSGVSKLHPDFWLLMVSHTGKTSVQQAFPLWHQDRTISNWKVSLFVCLSDLGEGVYKNLPWSDRQFGSRGSFFSHLLYWSDTQRLCRYLLNTCLNTKFKELSHHAG